MSFHAFFFFSFTGKHKRTRTLDILQIRFIRTMDIYAVCKVLCMVYWRKKIFTFKFFIRISSFYRNGIFFKHRTYLWDHLHNLWRFGCSQIDTSLYSCSRLKSLKCKSLQFLFSWVKLAVLETRKNLYHT